MTVAWHYSREGKKHGPVSSPELQALARKGLLNPEDLVWKEGMQKWEKAGRLKGLFPAVAAPPPPTPPTETSPKETSSTAASVKQSMSVLGASAKVGGELALKQAEKTKIQTLSLPQAYVSLGKAVYEQGTQHPDTAALFAAINDLNQQLAAIQSAIPASSEKATLSERAINLGKQAKAAVNAKSLESNLHRQYAQLGTLTYQRADLPNHEHVNAQDIRKLLEREKELSQQISALGEQMGAHGEQMQQMAKATARKGYSLLLTAATVATFPIAPLSWLPIWKHPGWGKGRKITLAMMSLACTIGLLAYTQIQSAAATKAVTSANAEWDNGNQEEAITQYRSLLPNSMFLEKGEQARVYCRLIEFDIEHDDKESARQLIEKADDRGLELNLTDPGAIEILAEYQQHKREEEERRKTRPTDYLTAEERNVLTQPKQKRSGNKGVEFVRTKEGWGGDVGYIYKDGKNLKDIHFRGVGNTTTNEIHQILMYGEDGQTRTLEVSFGKDGTLYSRTEYDSRGEEKYEVTFQRPGVKWFEKFYVNGLLRKGVDYHENGQKASEWYGNASREDDPRNVYWDAAGNTQTQDEYFTAKHGPTWRQDYSRESERAKQQNIKGLQEAFRRNGVGN